MGQLSFESQDMGEATVWGIHQMMAEAQRRAAQEELTSELFSDLGASPPPPVRALEPISPGSPASLASPVSVATEPQESATSRWHVLPSVGTWLQIPAPMEVETSAPTPARKATLTPSASSPRTVGKQGAVHAKFSRPLAGSKVATAKVPPVKAMATQVERRPAPRSASQGNRVVTAKVPEAKPVEIKCPDAKFSPRTLPSNSKALAKSPPPKVDRRPAPRGASPLGAKTVAKAPEHAAEVDRRVPRCASPAGAKTLAGRAPEHATTEVERHLVPRCASPAGAKTLAGKAAEHANTEATKAARPSAPPSAAQAARSKPGASAAGTAPAPAAAAAAGAPPTSLSKGGATAAGVTRVVPRRPVVVPAAAATAPAHKGPSSVELEEKAIAEKRRRARELAERNARHMARSTATATRPPAEAGSENSGRRSVSWQPLRRGCPDKAPDKASDKGHAGENEAPAPAPTARAAAAPAVRRVEPRRCSPGKNLRPREPLKEANRMPASPPK